MTKPAYYNEIDPAVCQWLENLIRDGRIAPGDVDNRSISNVKPSDLAGYAQCHFFAGIGVWSYALRCAGWDDHRPIWTASCPCQPFSTAGKGAGFADKRHLWPDFFHLVTQCQPESILGEQVASKDASTWLDLVQTDLEGMGYAFGAVPFPAASVGAPHIRDRLYWVGHNNDQGLEGFGVRHQTESGRDGEIRSITAPGEFSGLADNRMQQRSGCSTESCAELDTSGRNKNTIETTGLHSASSLAAHTNVPEHYERTPSGEQSLHGQRSGLIARQPPSGPTNGFWRDADWIFCRDGKWRPVESIPQQMVDGLAKSLGRVLPRKIEEIQKEMTDYASQTKIDLRETLLDVWMSLGAETLQRTTGRLCSVQEAPVLLSFLRQLADQGWEIAQSLPRPSSEIQERSLRMLWEQIQTSRAPYQRRLDGQQSKEYSDPVRILSSILARYAQEAWGETFLRNVQDAFPLLVDAKNRMVQLRAYGNAIVAPQAKIFIKTYMEYLHQ